MGVLNRGEWTEKDKNQGKPSTLLVPYGVNGTKQVWTQVKKKKATRLVKGMPTTTYLLKWKDDVTLHNAFWSDQHVTVEATTNSETVIISFIYSSLSSQRRHVLFNELHDFASSVTQAWCVVGDFNVISNWSEKKRRKQGMAALWTTLITL
ncbi:hypothetical protein QQ045_031428 [Rhodiola kirilowii]